MEWSRTKTYLIIALLITNIILLLNIYHERKDNSNNFNRKNLKNMEKLLSNMNISTDVKLSTDTLKMSSIELRYATIEDEELKNIRNNYNDKIMIIDDFYIEFSVNIDSNMNYDEIEKFSKDFIRKNLDEKNYRLKNYYKDDDIIILEYEELYERMFIEHGYIKFSYNYGDSIDISMTKTKDIRKVGKPIEIISNAEALSKLIPKITPNSIIKSIDIGYYKIEDWSDFEAHQARLVPFWRIEMENSTLLYTEAIKNY